MGSSATTPVEPRSGSRLFPTTHWSVVLNAGGTSSPEARTSLETLCRGYWYPLYSFIRRQGRTHHEAEDLAQAFFAQLLADEGIARARPERGRFRTFLLTSLRNYMINDWERTRAAKRGGGVAPLSFNFERADTSFAHEPRDDGVTPEQAFDRNWALGVIEQSLSELRLEYEASGRGRLFEAIAPTIWGGGPAESLTVLADRLGMQVTALKVAVHRVRKRLRERLRVQVAATVADEAEVASELRHLIASVGGNSRPM